MSCWLHVWHLSTTEFQIALAFFISYKVLESWHMWIFIWWACKGDEELYQLYSGVEQPACLAPSAHAESSATNCHKTFWNGSTVHVSTITFGLCLLFPPQVLQWLLETCWCVKMYSYTKEKKIHSMQTRGSVAK